MSEALAPACAAQRTVTILGNELVAHNTYKLTLDDPVQARQITPGQFVMVRAGMGNDPLLGRPFALFDVVRDSQGLPSAVELVYLVLGRGTAELGRKRAGEQLPIWGPLGNGFSGPPAEGGEVGFVAGGIGFTPFLALGKWWRGGANYGISAPFHSPFVSHARLYYGARSANLFAGLDQFAQAGIDVRTATDDGSLGHHGFVTDLLKADLQAGWKPSKLVGCGPAPMLKVLSGIAHEYGIPCDLSLENHMACGFGACFSCVTPIREPNGTTDLKRVCVEGPVFDSQRVVF